MDRYTHGSFTLLQTTEQIREVVDHVLSQPDAEVPLQLRRDLASWRDRKEDERRERNTSSSVEDIAGTISFELIKRTHKQLEKAPLGIVCLRVNTSCMYAHVSLYHVYCKTINVGVHFS